MSEKVIIIGSGPAGCTAAIYAARANLNPFVFEGLEPGGQLTITTDVENFPGYPDGVSGPLMMQDMKKQAERFGARFKTAQVTEVDLSNPPFKIKDGDTEHEADAIIIATGARARWLDLESERTLRGRGVSACATCDGAFFKDKEVAVVGGGDNAMEEAIFLTKFASKVTIIHRRQGLRASRIMASRARNNPKIEWRLNKVVHEIKDVEAGKVSGLTLKDARTGEPSEFPCEGLFVAIGHVPNTAVFKGQIDLDASGYIIPKEPGRTFTSVNGVFACGDCVDHTYRQAVTAAGTGCAAAMDCSRWLDAGL